MHAGREHNFNIYDDSVSDSLNVPYDYTSVMHYSKTAFRNGTEPTIVTRISDFEDVIGQRMDFSDYDLLKLNRLYNCCMWWVPWSDLYCPLPWWEKGCSGHLWAFWDYEVWFKKKKKKKQNSTQVPIY